MTTSSTGSILSFLILCQFVFEQPVLLLDRVSEGDTGLPHELQCDLPDEVRMFNWLKDGRGLDEQSLSWVEESDGKTLTSPALRSSDAGNYTCTSGIVKGSLTILIVRTRPGQLQNVTVHVSTTLATARWTVKDDGGYAITHFTLLYRLLNSTEDDWHISVPVHISPVARQFFVYHLRPGSTYLFRLWASNKLGPGDSVTLRATTISTQGMDPSDRLRLLPSTGDLKFGTSAWIIAVSMVTATLLILSCLSCILVYKEGLNDLHGKADDDDEAHIITNPLLEHADQNDNTERPTRLINNNSIVRPSRV